MAIHLVQRQVAFTACRKSAASDDVIILLGEGVTALLDGAEHCYATIADVEALGLANRAPASVQLITDAELVALCTKHAPVVTWTQQ